uniref:Uncharacterized protein n=1 Tax=Ditylenchus dipsaci TaxID=166011 RepID=A0A915EED7_9BILA
MFPSTTSTTRTPLNCACRHDCWLDARSTEPNNHLEEAGGLGIALEGTVDVVDGHQLCSHHFSEALRPNGPAPKSGMLKRVPTLLPYPSTHLARTPTFLPYLHTLLAQAHTLLSYPLTLLLWNSPSCHTCSLGLGTYSLSKPTHSPSSSTYSPALSTHSLGSRTHSLAKPTHSSGSDTHSIGSDAAIHSPGTPIHSPDKPTNSLLSPTYSSNTPTHSPGSLTYSHGANTDLLYLSVFWAVSSSNKLLMPLFFVNAKEDEQDIFYFHGNLPDSDVDKLLEKDGDFLIQSKHVIARTHTKLYLAIQWDSKVERREIDRLVGFRLAKFNVCCSTSRDFFLQHSCLEKLLELFAPCVKYYTNMSYYGQNPEVVAVKRIAPDGKTDQALMEMMKEARVMQMYDHKKHSSFPWIHRQSSSISFGHGVLFGWVLEDRLRSEGANILTARRVNYKASVTQDVTEPPAKLLNEKEAEPSKVVQKPTEEPTRDDVGSGNYSKVDESGELEDGLDRLLKLSLVEYELIKTKRRLKDLELDTDLFGDHDAIGLLYKEICGDHEQILLYKNPEDAKRVGVDVKSPICDPFKVELQPNTEHSLS